LPAAQYDKGPARPVARRTVNAARRLPPSLPGEPDRTQPAAADETLPVQPPSVESDKAYANVKTDSSAVYSSNSPESPIVDLLKNGEKVRTTLEIVDSRGGWNLVESEDDKRPGWVRRETLEYPSAGKTSSDNSWSRRK